MKISATEPQKILYVLGNGFDLHHNLPTSYSDFNAYCSRECKNISDFIDSTFNISNKPGEEWFDFEEGLGQFDIDSIYSNLTEDLDPDEFIPWEDAVDNFFIEDANGIRIAFNNWISTVDLNTCTKSLPFKKISSKSKYLTFNYTRVLEDVYYIQESSILHIHGQVQLDDDIIFGYKDCNDKYHLGNNYFEEESKKLIKEKFQEYQKNTKAIISENESFFKNLGEIELVYVFGHSYCDIDFDYYNAIAQEIDDATWFLNCYSFSDCHRVLELIENLEISNFIINMKSSIMIDTCNK